MTDLVEVLKIVLMSIAAAVLYGIAHDLVTTRVCVEYFTIGHPPILGGTTSPTLLALGWGVIATWWMGVLLGLPLAFIARLGRRPKLGVRDLVTPIGRLLLVMGLLSIGAGMAGYLYGGANSRVLGYFLKSIPEGRRVPFVADAFAHQMAYTAGGLGGVVVWIWAWRRRGKLARAAMTH